MATAVVAAGIVTAVALSGGGSPGADPSNGPSGSGSIPTSSGPSPTLETGPTGDAITWANFVSFSKMLGTSNGDTGHAFKGATCKVEGPEAQDLLGIVDQVKCTYASSPVVSYVARFSSASSVQSYLRKAINSSGYSVAPWALGGEPRGLEYVSPESASSRDIISTICALPTYLVQFFAQDGSTVSATTMHDTFWNAATFPDVTPPACSTNYLGSASGSTASADAGPNKTATAIDGMSLAAFLTQGDSDVKSVVVAKTDGSETMVVNQTGTVTFWKYDSSKYTITKIGRSTYPYAPKDLGPPKAVGRGTVLKGMVHATFIVAGVFSTDGSGNAVAYTFGSGGWGAIKAQKSGNLAPSGQGVGVSAIGLSQGFDFVNGLLETADCSSTLPYSQCGGNRRVLKRWEWDGSEFRLKSRAGLPR